MSETSMVVELVNHTEQFAYLASLKHKCKYTVYKPKGHYHFFLIKVDSGTLPHQLSGYFSSLAKGIEAVQKYIDNAKESFSLKSDRLHKERQERHATKANPSDD